jgi:hypothetical protein
MPHVDLVVGVFACRVDVDNLMVQVGQLRHGRTLLVRELAIS